MAIPLTTMLLASATACGGLLDVSDPTLIQDKDLANAFAANARRLSVVQSFTNQMPGAAYESGLFSDELTYDASAYRATDYNTNLDLRNGTAIEQYEANVSYDPHLENLNVIVSRSSVAINGMRSYGADSVRDDYLTQLFALRGGAILQIAEDMCSGFPINDISPSGGAILGKTYLYDSAVVYAITQLDSALAHATDSVQFVNLARVFKARALLDLGQYATAATTVAAVPTDFTYTTDILVRNSLGRQGRAWVADGDGGGLPFLSANDPRVTATAQRTRATQPSVSLYLQTKYPNTTVPMIVASGIEARLIEAEAAIHEPNPSKVVAIVDTLRATIGLDTVATPTSTDALIDLVYRERAFWLYLSGHRLGDLRRLVINYGRPQNTVFPSGAYPILNLTYGTATAIPFSKSAEARTNPNVTSGCIPDQPR